jgi:outer membrane protein assembly factor BamB
LGGQGQALFAGGDGWLYSFDPNGDGKGKSKLLWKFDCNPKDSKWILGGRGTRNNVISTPVIYDGLIYIGVGQDPEHGEGPGNFYAIDAAGKSGDISGQQLWHMGGKDFHRTMSSPSVEGKLIYIADLSGFVYCLDAKTGALHWKYDLFAAVWGSTFLADGKIYIGDEDGDLAVLKAGTKMELLHESNLGAAIYTTPVARDGVIYVATRTKLFAIEEGKQLVKPEPKPKPKPKPAADGTPGPAAR